MCSEYYGKCGQSDIKKGGAKDVSFVAIVVKLWIRWKLYKTSDNSKTI